MCSQGILPVLCHVSSLYAVCAVLFLVLACLTADSIDEHFMCLFMSFFERCINDNTYTEARRAINVAAVKENVFACL